MKKTLFGLVVTLFAAVSLASPPAAKLEQDFIHPPESARPQTWWHWMNGNVTKQGITADLEAMKRIGLGGAQIFSVSVNISPGLVKEVPYFSTEWREMVVHAAKECSRLGLELSALSGDGWSGGGGPWITPELAMQKLTWSETPVSGPTRFEAEVRQPATKLDTYRDIAVLAVPAAEPAKMPPAKKTVQQTPACWVQLTYAQPVTVRAIAVGKPKNVGELPRCELQVSDDGEVFRTVRVFETGWASRMSSYPEITVGFNAVRGRFFRLLLPNPPLKNGSVEFSLQSEARVSFWQLKAGFEHVREHGGGAPLFAMERDRTPPAPDNYIRQDQVVNLSDRMTSGGHLTWDVPEGNWTILRIGYTPTGRQCAPATNAGKGLECDKLSPRGIEAQFNAMLAKLLEQFGPSTGKVFTQAVIDSWEVGMQNWTSAFPDEFKKRRGYDLLPWLPVMTGGHIVGDRDRSERFLWDVRRTIADLIAENFFGYMAKLCHEHGIQFQGEPGGRQQYMYDPIVFQKQSDVPMGEFWMGGRPRIDCRTAASAAHLYGKPLVAAESFTGGKGAWQEDPFAMKSLGDFAFCMGINRFVFHRFAHQPWLNLAPGMTMGPWGIYMDRTNTWWEPGAAWIAYITRCQYMLQQGHFVADVVHLIGEGAPSSLEWNNDLYVPLPPGYDYDGCDAEAVVRLLSVKDGRLVTPSGMSYRMLLLPNVDAMTPAVARRVRDLVRDGAIVIGPRPTHSPSLEDYPRGDDEVRQIAKDVWGDCDGKIVTDHVFGKGRVVWGKTFAPIAAAIRLPADFEYQVEGPKATLPFIHRRLDDADLYFVSNQEERPVDAVCVFRVSGKTPELWQADSGAITTAAIYREKDGRTSVPIHFDPCGSTFVVFRRPSAGQTIAAIRKDGHVLQTPGQTSSHDVKTGPLTGPATLPIEDRYPNVTSHFTITAWVKPSQPISIPSAGSEGVHKIESQRFLIEPEQGEFAYGAGHAGVGLSVGTNGVCVIEHSSRYRPVRLAAKQPITDWTHLALVYRDGAPRLYLNGQPAGSAVASRYKVHPGARAGQGSHAFVGETRDLHVTDRVLSGEQIAAIASQGPRKQSVQPDTRPIDLQRADDGKIVATVWEKGRYSLETSDGRTLDVMAESMPTPLVIDGSWQVQFPTGWGAPPSIAMDRLISWPEYREPSVKYFSGTATYVKEIDIPAAMLGEGKVVALDLGKVKNLAEVSLNGKPLGVLWKAPFRVNITEAARPGQNHLEIRVTNLWPNRLIGDEQRPPDCKYSERGFITQWPKWVSQDKPHASANERYAFTTWKHYTKNSPLLESGLIGPVRLLGAIQRTVTQ